LAKKSFPRQGVQPGGQAFRPIKQGLKKDLKFFEKKTIIVLQAVVQVVIFFDSLVRGRVVKLSQASEFLPGR